MSRPLRRIGGQSLLMFAALIAAPAAYAQAPLVNPSFESPLLLEGQTLNPLPSSSGWQVRGAVALVNGGIQSTSTPFRIEAPMGRQWISMRPGNSISQTLTLSPGTYYLTGQAMQVPGYSTAAPLRVKLGTTVVATQSPGASIAKLTFASITIAATGSYQLTIDVPEPASGTPVPAGVYLDDIVLNVQGTNSKPSVAVAYPQPGQAFSGGSSVALQAAAVDPDGTIAKVEFYDGATLLGTVFSAPWTYSLATNTSATRNITAKAFDNAGATNISEATQFSHNTGGGFPYIINSTFESPILSPGSGIDAYGYYVSGWNASSAVLATAGYVADTYYPFTQALQGRQSMLFTMSYGGGSAYQTISLPAGNYGLSLRASVGYYQELRVQVPGALATISSSTTGNSGKFYVPFSHTGGGASFDLQALRPYSNSAYSPIVVDDIIIGPAGPPTVSMRLPVSGQSFSAPAAIPLQAKVDVYDRDIAKVEYFEDAILIGRVTAAPYLFDWLNVRAGTHAITAKVTDSLGNVTTSSPISITVTAGPQYPAFFNAGFERTNSVGSFSSPMGWYSAPGAAAYSAGNGSSWINGAPAAPEGIAVAFFNGFAAMSQDVDMPAGGTYKITFKAAQQAAGGYVNVRVRVNGADVGLFTPGASFASYTTNAFTIGAAGLKTVRFEGASPGNSGYVLLDDLSLVAFTPTGSEVPVPNDPPASLSATSLTFAAQPFG
ncbi:MAG: Ig-like domain-containing protein, partial [Betaproteobacteria bacterium]